MWLRGNDKRAVHIMEEKGAQGKKNIGVGFPQNPFLLSSPINKDDVIYIQHGFLLTFILSGNMLTYTLKSGPHQSSG